MENKRIQWLDFARGIGIILVVLGHCIMWFGKDAFLQSLNVAIYSFHMPLFFVLSGINLNTQKAIKTVVLNKFKKVFLPTYFFFIFATLITLITLPKDQLQQSLNSLIQYHNIIKVILCMRNSGISGWWFLPVLFLTQVFCLFILKFKRRITQLLSIAALFLISIIYAKTINKPLPFFIEETFIALPFVYIGYLAKSFLIDKSVTKKQAIFALLSWAIGLTISLHDNSGTVNMWNSEIHNIILFFTNAISGSLLIIFFSKHIDKLALINHIGKISLYIFGFHYIFLGFLGTFTKAHPLILKMPNLLVILLFVIFIITCSLILTELLRFLSAVIKRSFCKMRQCLSISK